MTEEKETIKIATPTLKISAKNPVIKTIKAVKILSNWDSTDKPVAIFLLSISSETFETAIGFLTFSMTKIKMKNKIDK